MQKDEKLETKIDTKKTALLLSDLQNSCLEVRGAFVDGTARRAQAKGVVGNIAKVIGAARQVGIPIFYTADVHRKDHTDAVPKLSDLVLKGVLSSPSWEGEPVEGTHAAEFVPATKPAPGDYIIYKCRFDAFYGTELELQLRCLGIDTIIIGGLVTDVCVVATVLAADQRDFNIIVLSDCCSTLFEENADAVDDFFMNTFFPIWSRVRTSDEVIAAMTEANTQRKAT